MENKNSPQSPGGKATAILLRKRALAAYSNSPTLCKNCNNTIPVQEKGRVRDAKRKIFCSRACRTIWHRQQRPIKELVESHPVEYTLNLKSRGDVWRQSVSKDARRVTKDRLRVCERCGYDKHVQVCHLKPVATFSFDALLKDINTSENLILLCPNCHWELDHPAVS